MKKLVVLLAACTSNEVVVSPVIDVPVPSDNASAFPVEEITLAVAHQGAAAETISATFHKGDTIELAGVPFGDDLVFHMTGRIGTSEVAYGRTCTFAVSPRGPAPAPHLFFSRSVRFADLGYNALTRSAGNAITFPDGSAILLGGTDPNDNSGVDIIERLDPHTGEFRQFGAVQPRRGAIAAVLGTKAGESRIALIGGVDQNGSGAAFIEIIDPSRSIDERIEQIAEPQMAREFLTATPLTDGRVIVIGGLTPGMPKPSKLVHELAIENGTPTVRQLRAQLKDPRWKHTATRLGDDVGAGVLVAGGLDELGLPLPNAELFKPVAEEFSMTPFPMKTPRSRHAAVRMPDGSVLIIGGLDATGTPVSKLERFSLDAGFVDMNVGELPLNAGLVDFTATTLPDGRVLLTGGKRFTAGAPLDSAFIIRLDPTDGSVDVIATDHLSVARAGHEATLLCDGTVLVAGGTTNPVPAERYNPPAFGRR